MRSYVLMVCCAVCVCAGCSAAETADLSLRLENGAEFYTYREVVLKTELIGANAVTSQEIREYDFTLELGEEDTDARTREVVITYDRVYFSVQTDNPPSELTYDSTDPDSQSDYLKRTHEHAVGMSVVLTLDADTNGLLSTVVPGKPGLAGRSGGMSKYVHVDELRRTVGEVVGCGAGSTAVDVGDAWTIERGVYLKGVNAPMPATREVRVAEAGEGGVVIEFSGDIELNTGAYNLRVADSGITGGAVWDSETGSLSELHEVIHGELTGDRKGDPVIVTLRREQEIIRR